MFSASLTGHSSSVWPPKVACGIAAMALACRSCAALLWGDMQQLLNALVQLLNAAMTLECCYGAAVQELAWMEDTARAEQQLRHGGAETFADRW